MGNKMKTLGGIARKHGKKDFLECAKYYSCHVSDSVQDTINQMESRWHDRTKQITEAENMLIDYNNKDCILSEPPNYACVDMGQVSK